MSRWKRRIIDAVLIVGVVLAVQAWHKRDAVSGPLPPFAAGLASGQLLSSGEWLQGHPGRAAALYFWASWCPICRSIEGNVDAVGRDWPVLTVAMQSGDAAMVSQHLAARGLQWPALVDADGGISARFGLHAVPALVVVDPRGDIRFVEIGYTSEIGMRLRLWWAQQIGS